MKLKVIIWDGLNLMEFVISMFVRCKTIKQSPFLSSGRVQMLQIRFEKSCNLMRLNVLIAFHFCQVTLKKLSWTKMIWRWYNVTTENLEKKPLKEEVRADQK